MLRGIEAVHNIGILHRDIKPGNFCIAKDFDTEIHYRPICYLIDFGLSRRFINPGGSVRDVGIHPKCRNDPMLDFGALLDMHQ